MSHGNELSKAPGNVLCEKACRTASLPLGSRATGSNLPSRVTDLQNLRRTQCALTAGEGKAPHQAILLARRSSYSRVDNVDSALVAGVENPPLIGVIGEVNSSHRDRGECGGEDPDSVPCQSCRGSLCAGSQTPLREGGDLLGDASLRDRRQGRRCSCASDGSFDTLLVFFEFAKSSPSRPPSRRTRRTSSLSGKSSLTGTWGEQ